jgi:hypothetical protein
MKPSHQTVLAFSASALMGLALHTRDCFAVDGAPRCLAVYRHPTLLFHPDNHLLYLVNVLTWTRMAGLLGFKLSDPLDFIFAVDTMHCLAAAGCLAVLYWIILRVTSSWKLRTAVCVAHGLTTAFLAQATNPNEPMLGALWSFLGITFAIPSGKKACAQ